MKIPKDARQKSAMALPLTLVVLLFGTVLVATAFYIVQNMYSTSRQVVTHSQLYNAAQSGLERGRADLWENRESLGTDEIIFDGDIESLYVKIVDSNGNPVGVMGPLELDVEPDIRVKIEFFDTNYDVGSYTFSPEMPPQHPGGTGLGEGSEWEMTGTSAIMDPARYLPLGGGSGAHRYVIRSRATSRGRAVALEAMVVIVK